MVSSGSDLTLFLLIAIPALILLLFAGMVIFGWDLIRQLEKLVFVQLTEQEEDQARSRAEEFVYPVWFKKRNFEWIGAYYSQVEFSDYHSVTTKVRSCSCVWKQKNLHRYICVHVAKAGYWMPTKVGIDITSLYGDSHSITTVGSDSGPMFPPAPGIYKQIFKSKHIGKLWDWHQETEKLLEPAIPAPRNRTDKRPFQEVLTKHTREDATHIRTIRFWPLKIPWWYFVNRRRNFNKTAIEQMSPEEKESLGLGEYIHDN